MKIEQQNGAVNKKINLKISMYRFKHSSKPYFTENIFVFIQGQPYKTCFTDDMVFGYKTPKP